MGCPGCVNIDKPFWGECDVKKCCESKKHDHCGQCAKFACPTLTSYSYAAKEGDNGERIMNSQLWAFDVEKFCHHVAAQNADELMKFFVQDAVICIHDDNQQLTVAEYVRLTCEYPSTWQGEVQRIEKINGGLMTVTKMFSPEEAYFITSFYVIVQGKITRMDEYWSELKTDLPQWRKDMGIGKPIS